jgi:RNA polymerase-binding transcription factor DksA
MSDEGELDLLAGRLDAIEAVMARLDAGTYGRCESCGEVLDEEVLSSDATAPRCASCAGTRSDG